MDVYLVVVSYAFSRDVMTKPFATQDEAIEYVKSDIDSEKKIEMKEMSRTKEQLIEKHDDDWLYASLEICYDNDPNDIIEWRILERDLSELIPGTLKRLTVINDKYGRALATTRVFAVPSEDFDLMGAIVDATGEYYRSEASADVRRRCGEHDLRFADFDAYVPDEICARHGFKKIGINAVPDIYTGDVLIKGIEIRNGKAGDRND